MCYEAKSIIVTTNLQFEQWTIYWWSNINKSSN